MNSHHNWALVTGAIRNDFYLRIILIKLCEMRSKGCLDGIVLSTWDGDLDAFPGLRDGLHKLNVEIVEIKDINTTAANIYNKVGYERQWATLEAGLKIIPDDCFVLKLRTDFVDGIISFLKIVEDGKVDLSVKKYGSFNLLYNYKIVYNMYGIHQIMFVNDRFFYGYKVDLLKNNTHISDKKTHRFLRFTDNLLTNGFSFQNIPLLSNVWNIISLEFYDKFIQYCRTATEENLVLPKIILRIYATLCVHIYCHIYTTNNTNSARSDKPVALLDFLRNVGVCTNMQIEKIVMGELVPSRISNDFKEELRKIALDLPEAKQYTYQEYIELRKFVEKQLKDPKLIAEYPFVIKDNKKELCDGKKACEILFSDTLDKKLISAIADSVSVNFNGVGKSIFDKIPISEFGENKITVVKSAVYDRHSKAMFIFCEEILKSFQVYDAETWSRLIRNIEKNALFKPIQSYDLAVFYLASKIYKRFLSSDPEASNAYLLTWLKTKNSANSKYIGFECGQNFCQEEAYLNRLAVFLHEKAIDGSFGKNEIEIAKALLLIAPDENPFSANVIEKLEENGLKKEADEAEVKYSDKPFDICNFAISERAKKLVDDYRKGNADINNIFEYAYNTEGRLDSIFLGNVLLKEKWDNSGQQSTEIDEYLHHIMQKFVSVPYVFRLNFLSDNSKIELSNDVGFEEEWTLLLDIMSQKQMIGVNYDSLSKICVNVRYNRMQLDFFAAVEKDSRIKYFSQKNYSELWFNYRPFILSEINKELTVPKNAEGYLWPYSERPSQSSFAGFIKLRNRNCIFLSVELCADECEIAENMLRDVGITDYRKVNEKIIRLLTRDYTIQNEHDIANVINSALEDFCAVGKKLAAIGKSTENAPSTNDKES